MMKGIKIKNIKKKYIITLILLLILGYLTYPFIVGKPIVWIGPSSKFTREEIQDVADDIVKEYQDCETILLEVSYNEFISNEEIKIDLESSNSSIRDISSENIMVLNIRFITGPNAGGSWLPWKFHTGYKKKYIRKDENSPWVYYDGGYA